MGAPDYNKPLPENALEHLLIKEGTDRAPRDDPNLNSVVEGMKVLAKKWLPNGVEDLPAALKARVKALK